VTACDTKPLHRLAHEFEYVAHVSLRGELSLIVALAAEELERPGSRNAARLREFHSRASRLLDTMTAHFHREETRLFPAVRLVEDGVSRAASRLSSLVLDLRRDHALIRARLDEIRDLIDDVAGCAACPLVEMLHGSLLRVADDLESHLDDEERNLFPDVVTTAVQAAAVPA
jgi:iron-sulfur cluster repair protein YtfE (RIC family)